MGNVCANFRKYPSKGSPRSNKSATKSFLSTHKPRLEDISRRSSIRVPVYRSKSGRKLEWSEFLFLVLVREIYCQHCGQKLPMATAVVGCLGTVNDFFVGPRSGPSGSIFTFEVETGTSLVEAFAFVSVVDMG